MSVDFSALILAAKRTVIDDKKISQLRERRAAAEREFEAEDRAKAVTHEVLAQTYNI